MASASEARFSALQLGGYFEPCANIAWVKDRCGFERLQSGLMITAGSRATRFLQQIISSNLCDAIHGPNL